MRRKIRRFFVGVVLSMVFILNGTINTFAASSVSGSLGGQVVKGSVTKDTTSATAKTTCTRSASVSTVVTIYYTSGGVKYYSTETVSTSGGTATATVSRRVDGATVKGAKGNHSVYFDEYSWNKTTTIGTVYTNATKK